MFHQYLCLSHTYCKGHGTFSGRPDYPALTKSISGFNAFQCTDHNGGCIHDCGHANGNDRDSDGFLGQAVRWFPTPEPGWIPVSVSWIVEFSLFVERAARASITIMTSGSVCFTTPRMISAVSIPFFAITPGASALISCIFLYYKRFCHIPG